MTRAFLRLATLGIVHAAVTVTLPKNASFLVEVMKLDGSSDTYKLPVCCDLRVAAADLCAVASQPEEAAACLVQFLPDLAARRDSALAEGLLELPVVITYGGNATDATRTAAGVELVVGWWTQLRDYRLSSSARVFARAACDRLQGARNAAGACGACVPSLVRALTGSSVEAMVDEAISMREEATIRAVFGGQLSRHQCVTPRPELWLERATLAPSPVDLDAWPRAFWRTTEGAATTATSAYGPLTGIDRAVRCAAPGSPVTVWFNNTELRHGGGGYFDAMSTTLVAPSLAAKKDNAECADVCIVVDDPARADFLVSEQRPAAKVRPTQRTVRMSVEALDVALDPAAFDLQMDISASSNVPLLLSPLNFYARARALPPPTAQDIGRRKLAAWFSSNCHRTTWDRYGYAEALKHELGEDFHAGGFCLRDEAVDDGGATARELDTIDGERAQLALLSNYMFVFAFVNAREDDNVDEKFFLPFLANTVPVAVQGSAARRLAPGGPGSYVDATQYESPAVLARHLRWLRDHPREYLRFFDYRKAPPRSEEALLDAASVYAPSTLCRLCACRCDTACLARREVSRCGYAAPERPVGAREVRSTADKLLAPPLAPNDQGGSHAANTSFVTLSVRIDDLDHDLTFDPDAESTWPTIAQAFVEKRPELLTMMGRGCEAMVDDYALRLHCIVGHVVEAMEAQATQAIEARESRSRMDLLMRSFRQTRARASRILLHY